MADTSPRPLTPEELARLDVVAAQTSGAAPLQVPPGSQISVENIDPTATPASAVTAPKAGPPDQPDSSGGSSGSKPAPTRKAPKS